MIPSDVVSRLQLPADAAVTRVPTVQQVTDALGDLVPGQRVLAEIQALLPNGAYRALVNQRDVTLALPFSAKAGDSLELEVVDSDGKLTLAVVSRRTDASAGLAAEHPAVDTTLSRTGSFIAALMSEREPGGETRATQLNAQQPISPTPPQKAADLVPLLKQAISESGMFYESHQSQWVSARLPTEALLAEPQGRLSAVLSGDAAASASRGQETNPATMAKGPEANAMLTRTASDGGESSAAARMASANAALPTAIVAPELVPLVQQQLEALATQNYVWQGTAWPGQQMQWEIVEEDGQRPDSGDADAPAWQTRLTLTMPSLGEVRAALRLVNGEVSLSLSADSAEAAGKLLDGSANLNQQLQAAGLGVNGLTVTRHERPTD